MKYKVGDKIRLKSLDLLDRDDRVYRDGALHRHKTSLCVIAPDMHKHLGQDATIVDEVLENGEIFYELDVDFRRRDWADWMIDSKTHYKVGDKIRIKTRDEFLNGKGMYQDKDNCIKCTGEPDVVNQTMLTFAGKVTTVVTVRDSKLHEGVKIYALDVDNYRYSWFDWMINGYEETPMKFKKGDLVRIKPEWVEKLKTSRKITGKDSSMSLDDKTTFKYKDVIFEIDIVDVSKKFYKMTTYKLLNWEDWMLESVELPKIKTEFKEGDKVKIKTMTDLKKGKYYRHNLHAFSCPIYGGIISESDRQSLRPRIFTVKTVDEYGVIKFEEHTPINTAHYWMLEKAKVFKITTPKFKIGDKVKVRSKEWIKSNTTKTGYYVNRNDGSSIKPITALMRELAGQSVTISGITTSGKRYTIENNTGSWENWMFEDEAVKELEKPKPYYLKIVIG